MNQELLGAKLRQAREQIGVSQQHAAEALSMPRTAITNIENGKRAVSTLELSQLADLYNKAPSYFLNSNLIDANEGLVVLYRMESMNSAPDAKIQVEKYAKLCQEGLKLERLLGRDERSYPPLYWEPVPPTAWEAVAQGERVAEQERKRLCLGSGPLPDLADLINDQNIWASGAQLPDYMSGVFLSDASLGLAVLVNAEHSKGRKRFSYAHEYAHALIDRELKATVSLSKEAPNRETSELIEKRANSFAAAFLMPAEGVAALLDSIDKGKSSRSEAIIFDVANNSSIDVSARQAPQSQTITYQDVALISNHFEVSYHAAAFRLKSLRYINAEELESLIVQADIGNNYLKALKMFDALEKPSEESWARELNSHIAHLAIEAYRREEISRGKLMEISKNINMSAQEFLAFAEAARSN